MERIVEVLIVSAIFICVGLISALPTMWVWNWLAQDVFNIKVIHIGQAFGVNIILFLLIGGLIEGVRALIKNINKQH